MDAITISQNQIQESKSDMDYRTSHMAPGYGWYYSGVYQKGYLYYQWEHLELPLIEKIFHALSQNNHNKLIDFACGTGRILRVAERYFKEPVGIDISESMLEVARTDCKESKILKMDITREILDEKFDVVTAFRFFVNAEERLRLEALSAIYDLLKNDGVFVTNIHVNSKSILGYFYRLRNLWSEWVQGEIDPTEHFKKFKELLESKGFEIVEVYWYGYLPHMGSHLEWVSKYLMVPIERAWPKIFPQDMAQNFICVCKKVPTQG